MLIVVPMVVAASGQVALQIPQSTPVPADSAEFFEAKIRPILASNCYECHTDERLGGLRLDSREAMLAGGRSNESSRPA